VALLLLLVQVSGVAAADCETEDRYGDTRECTLTEELGSCLYDAGDSYEQCMDDSGGFWGNRFCEAALLIDTGGCLWDLL
jgi:hypothetical protein